MSHKQYIKRVITFKLSKSWLAHWDMANFTCEYLQDNQRCKAITKGTEGMATRKKFCERDEWNNCCYFCEHQGSCEISCSFKGTSDTISQSTDVDMEIAKCQERMEKLASLFADGKIGEQSYVAASATLEKKLARLSQAKENPSAALSISEPSSSELDESEMEPNEKPTALWYIVPFFFGIIGGLVGYVGTKDEDEDTANNLLIFGILWTIVLVILYYALITALLRR